MSTLTVSGAHLFYEVTGSGPLLVLIPGASGTGASFRPLVPHLIAHYQVVTYDRRGFSRSVLDAPQDYTHRLTTDADDVRRLIEHLSNQPICVFGSSSGAIVALEVLRQSPEQIQTIIAHEPPAVSFLPDATTWVAFFDEVYETYRAEGIARAMQQFGSAVLGNEDQQVMERVRREHAKEELLSNTTYWLEHELRQYPRVALDLAALAASAERIVLAGGQTSHDQMTYQPSCVLANALGQAMVDFPGGHLGFLSHPAAFAMALTSVLRGKSL